MPRMLYTLSEKNLHLGVFESMWQALREAVAAEGWTIERVDPHAPEFWWKLMDYAQDPEAVINFGNHVYDLHLSGENLFRFKPLTEFFACRMVASIGDHPFMPSMMVRLRCASSGLRFQGAVPGFGPAMRICQVHPPSFTLIDPVVSYGAQAQQQPFDARPIDLLIGLNVVTCKTLSLLRAYFPQRGSPERRLMEGAYDALRQDRENYPLRVANAVVQSIFGHSMEDNAVEFSRRVDLARFICDVDLVVRRERREEILQGLLRDTAGLRVMMIDGGFPEELSGPHVDVVPRVPASKFGELLGQSKVSLHVHPTYPGGLHERMVNTMAAGAALLTDPTPALRRWTENQDYALVHPGETLRQVVERVGAPQFAPIAAAGPPRADREFSAAAHARRLIALATEAEPPTQLLAA